MNDSIKSTCNLLAANRFVAFTQDLYHGEADDTVTTAERLSSALEGSRQQARARIAQAAAALSQHTIGDEGCTL